jgi:hypothetical protein
MSRLGVKEAKIGEGTYANVYRGRRRYLLLDDLEGFVAHCCIGY